MQDVVPGALGDTEMNITVLIGLRDKAFDNSEPEYEKTFSFLFLKFYLWY